MVWWAIKFYLSPTKKKKRGGREVLEWVGDTEKRGHTDPQATS